MGGSPRVHAVVHPPELGHHIANLGKFLHGLAQVICHARPFRKRDSGRQRHLQPERPFVELGQKLAPHGHAQDDGKSDRYRAGDKNRPRSIENGRQVAVVGALTPFHHQVAKHPSWLGEIQQREYRSEREGDKRAAQQGIGDCEGNGLEEFAFDALEGEERQVGDDDDRHGKQHRAGDLESGRAGRGRIEQGGGMPLAPLEQILEDHDGTVDDDAEVDSP